MPYKTIVLELLQQHPRFHEQLRTARLLLGTMEILACELKFAHEAALEQLTRAHPHRDPSQLRSEALEIALQELQVRLPGETSSDDESPLSLDAAMNYLRAQRPTG